MTYYKQLCAELVETWDATADFDYKDFGNAVADLVDRIRAALAEPEPEGPTDEELLCIAAKSIEPYDQILPGEYEPESNSAVEIYGSELIIYARAVLARWGNHPASPDSSLQSVPVSERLPGPRDCDSEGRCWWAEPQIEDSHDATWNLCTQEDAEEFLTWGTKYGWLPAYALPLPSYPTSLSS